MLKTYGILGTGNTSKNVIEDALNELGTDNNYIVTCGPKPSESEARIFEWLIGMEVPYTIVHNDRAPEKYVDAASAELVTEKSIDDAVIKNLDKTHGSLLLLWDDAKGEQMESICIKAADLGVPILDLTNGLVPITVEGDSPKEEPTPIPTEEVEIEPFSRDEMLSMSIGVLKKTAKSQGIQVTPSMTKETIVDAILNDKFVEEILTVQEEEEDIQLPIDLGTFRIVSTGTQQIVTSSEETCMLTATFPGGMIMSRTANVEEVKQLFGYGSTI
jgi:hypothetical protein